MANANEKPNSRFVDLLQNAHSLLSANRMPIKQKSNNSLNYLNSALAGSFTFYRKKTPKQKQESISVLFLFSKT
jgi:hypothetical protein